MTVSEFMSESEFMDSSIANPNPSFQIKYGSRVGQMIQLQAKYLRSYEKVMGSAFARGTATQKFHVKESAVASLTMEGF